MDSGKEKKIRDNRHTLINETENQIEVLSILKQKNVITQSEFNDVSKAASSMGFKSQMYYLILAKDDYAYHHLVEVLKETENDVCYRLLSGEGSEDSIPKIEVEVLVEKSGTEETLSEPDQEGIAIADEIEKEMDRIESEDDSSCNPELELEVQQEVVEETQLTAPEPKPRKAVSFDKNADPVTIVEEKPEPKQELTPAATPEPELVVVNGNNMVNGKDDNDDDNNNNYDGEDPSQWKSIVAKNREKFGGEGKFNRAKFEKKASVNGGTEPEPDSEFKNLRKYFQRLSSVERN